MKNRLNKIKMALLGGTVLVMFAARFVFATEYFVDMTDLDAFDPDALTIGVGDTVTWVNNTDFEDHTSTSNTGVWDSGDVGPGEIYSRTFNSPGTFPYHCIYHANPAGTSGMIGTITVTNVVLPTLSAPVRENNSQFQFTISGTSGKTYIIEVSSNLTSWTAIDTNVAPSNVFNYTNTSATNLAQFYRVRQEP